MVAIHFNVYDYFEGPHDCPTWGSLGQSWGSQFGAVWGSLGQSPTTTPTWGRRGSSTTPSWGRLFPSPIFFLPRNRALF